MRRVKSVLTLTVYFEDESENMTQEEMKQQADANLKRLVRIASGEGLFSDDGPMIVDSWDSQIESTVTVYDKETEN